MKRVIMRNQTQMVLNDLQELSQKILIQMALAKTMAMSAYRMIQKEESLATLIVPRPGIIQISLKVVISMAIILSLTRKLRTGILVIVSRWL